MTNMDDKLMAYLDGELAEADRTALEAQLSSDPALAQRLEELNAGDRHLEAFLAADTFENIRPDTARLAVLLAAKLDRQPEATGQEEEPAQVIFLDHEKKQRGFPGRAFIPHAAAASVALIIGFGAGYVSPGKQAPDQGTLVAEGRYLAGIVPQGTALHAALETRPSEEYPRAAGTNEPQMVPLTSFRTREGTYCREYIVAGAEGGSRGLACKAEDIWRVQASVAIAVRDTASDGFIPASDSDVGPIDALIMEMMAGDVFSLDEEQQAIRDGWK
jgi:anti-sigma factor RsiW